MSTVGADESYESLGAGGGRSGVPSEDKKTAVMEYKQLFRQRMDLEARFKALAVMHAEKCIAIANRKRELSAAVAATYQQPAYHQPSYPQPGCQPSYQTPQQVPAVVAPQMMMNTATAPPPQQISGRNVYCEVCKIYTSDVEGMQQHLSGAKHHKALAARSK